MNLAGEYRSNFVTPNLCSLQSLQNLHNYFPKIRQSERNLEVLQNIES
jgi:hypothetical protein